VWQVRGALGHLPARHDREQEAALAAVPLVAAANHGSFDGQGRRRRWCRSSPLPRKRPTAAKGGGGAGGARRRLPTSVYRRQGAAAGLVARVAADAHATISRKGWRRRPWRPCAFPRKQRPAARGRRRSGAAGRRRLLWQNRLSGAAATALVGHVASAPQEKLGGTRRRRLRWRFSPLPTTPRPAVSDGGGTSGARCGRPARNDPPRRAAVAQVALVTAPPP